MTTDPTPTHEPGERRPELESNWRSLVGVGSLLAVLGLFAIGFPNVSSISLSIVLGTILVVGGIVQIAHAFSARKWTGFVWQALIAVVYTGLGILVLAEPSIGLVTLTLLLIAQFLAVGLIEILLGVGLKGYPNRLWPIFSGVVSLVAAAMLALGLPSTEPWAIGLIFGVNLFVSGVSLVMLALGARKAAAVREATPPSARIGGA
jgi:uncharacterized membrane protein HdeD (DUF308 family)